MTKIVPVEQALLYVDKLDEVLRTVIGADYQGYSRAPNGNTLTFLDSVSAGEQATALAMVTAHHTLVVGTDKATITADDSDTATITCSDGGLGADAMVDYTVWRNNVLYSEGSANVVGGTVTLTLKSAVAGTFVIEVRRQVDNYASGYVALAASVEAS